MFVPRFERSQLNQRLVSEDLGETFTRLVRDVLLKEYPRLHLFPTGGKDGAIDFVSDDLGTRSAGDCKALSEDGVQPALAEWKKVADRLDRNLAEPAGPLSGQAQYRPWYRSEPRIGEYLFCVSSFVKNLGQGDALQDTIVAFFQGLANRPHLSHLRDAVVRIFDWSDLSTLLLSQPALLLRWFPHTRPAGLVPLDDVPDAGSFRAYLAAEKLKHYSRRAHLEKLPSPQGAIRPDEDALLARIDRKKVTGLILTGSGGVGKTRLSLELGRSSAARGDLVLRAVGPIDTERLQRLGEQLDPSTSALVLFDYVETQRAFDQVVELLNALNDTFGLRIGYVANCRTSYYSSLQGLTRHERIDLTPPAGHIAADWERSYRLAVVDHVLDSSGVGSSDAARAVCRELPVLAVFLAYLRERGRHDELRELLEEKDFGSWMARRILASFGGDRHDRELAELIAMFPLDDQLVGRLSETAQRLFDRLATDGWIERLDTVAEGQRPTWVTAHDVFADQILLSYAETVPHNPDHFVRDLLARSAAIGTLRSSLVALQRIRSYPPLNTVRWADLIETAVTLEPQQWSPVRDLLLQTSLLRENEIVAFLKGHAAFWRDAERDVQIQNRLGWLARHYLRDEPGSLTKEGEEVLRSWLVKAAPYAKTSNFCLTWGLRFGADVRGASLAWIQALPTLFQTHYLMVAWLECGMPPQEIASGVEGWLSRWRRLFHASFVYRSWLDAKGEVALVEQPIRDWLGHEGNRLLPEASFVYQGWLDAKGDLGLVEQPIRDWLGHEGNRLLPGARFVYSAWLDAKGDVALVEQPIRDWLAHEGNQLLAEASFVYQGWLDAKGDVALVDQPIRDWLGHEGNRLLPEANFVYKAWLDAKGDLTLVEQPIRDWLAHEGNRLLPEAQFVYHSWLVAKGDVALVEQPIRDWLGHEGNRLLPEASFVYRGWLVAKGDLALVEQPIRDWLGHEGNRLLPEASFVYQGWLDAKGDLALVEQPIREWLGHEENRLLAEASFVYQGWLDAKGDLALVEQPTRDWLGHEGNRLLAEANFVYRAWLDAGAPLVAIETAVLEWIKQHPDEEGIDFLLVAYLRRGGALDAISEAAFRAMKRLEAAPDGAFLSKVLARSPAIPADVVRSIIRWCREFRKNPDAMWRLSQLGQRLILDDVAIEAVSACKVILAEWIGPKSEPAPDVAGTVTNVTNVLSILAIASVQWPRYRMGWGYSVRQVEIMVAAWIRNAHVFATPAQKFVQRPRFVDYVDRLVKIGTLDRLTDRQALQRFAAWVCAWDPSRIAEIDPRPDWLP